MKFHMIVLLCAFLALTVALIFVYYQLKDENINKLFPAALTGCPDDWAINPNTGKCIIPNREINSANLGNLKNSDAKMIYVYTFDNGKIVYSTQSVIKSLDGSNIFGEPYVSPTTGQHVYHYSSNAYSKPFPYGYPNQFDPNDVEQSNEIDFTQWSINSYKDIVTMQRENIVGDICAVKAWANSNNIAWDGIKNYNGTCAYS